MPWSYLGLQSFKAAITIPSADSADDARLRAVLEAVSQQIDQECGRTFRTYLATRYLSADQAGRILLDADLLSVITLKGDAASARTYTDLWAVTDYDLIPDNAVADRSPYQEIATAPSGEFGFPTGARRGVQIVGKWGYWEDLFALSATLNEALDATETGVDVTAVTELEVGQTILVDAEQMYVTAFPGPNTATVERGVNGTTAATHALGAAVSRYRYPGPIVEATRIQAARVFQRVHAPFGIQGSAEMGTVAVIARIDPDVKMLLQRYRSGLGMCV
jgi:hypothetical protein